MPDQGREDPTGGWRHPGWSWTVRKDWLISAATWVAGLLVAFVLGNVPSLITGDWKSGKTWVSLWLSVALSVAAFAAAAFAWAAIRNRKRMIRQNGTAYIIQEQARFWDKDGAARFREGIRRQFARVVQVPGPVEVRRDWDWSLNEDALDWDLRADELVRAFQVLSIDGSRAGSTTPNGVFLWAYWPVAVAFGMRVTAADRDATVLDVWQRPGNARAGQVEPQIWAQRPHRFGSTVGTGAATGGGQAASGMDSGLEFTESAWPATLEATRMARGGWFRPAAVRPISVLLIRFSAEQWGPLPPVTQQPDGPLTLGLRTAVHLPTGKSIAGKGPHGVAQVELHELRCVPPRHASGKHEFPWDQFPALAAKAAAWIEEKTKELDGHTLLLGTALPQEVGLGLGILAGRVSRRSVWPARLWPIVFDPGKRDLVVPNLQLGSVAVDPALADSGGA
jgi:hypothetical protein